MTKKDQVANCKDWIKYLETADPGEWWLDQYDMDLIKEALQLWLKSQSGNDYRPSIQVILNGKMYEVKV